MQLIAEFEAAILAPLFRELDESNPLGAYEFARVLASALERAQ